MLSYVLWNGIFHVTMVTRLFLMKVSPKIKYLYFSIGYGTWSLVIIVIAIGLDYIISFPGVWSYVEYLAIQSG